MAEALAAIAYAQLERPGAKMILGSFLAAVSMKSGAPMAGTGELGLMNLMIGLITPPVGTVLNVVAGVGRMRMDDVTRGVLPFMVAQFALMFLLVLFPQLVLVPLRWFY